ncbi:MAG: adenylate/guanylate cyclase domain-containing protein [Gallionella sp.]|nr:adenylate/guanylate cyclase domain-containing protein [Gallionella sp.]
MTTSSNIEREMAVLFADVSGSTRLYELLGDTRAFAAVNDSLNLLRRVTAAHGGRVVKTIGDEIMAVFPNAAVAVQAACEMQDEVTAQPAVEKNIRIAIRIGFHCGSVLENQKDGDVFGDNVNIAARMTEIAQSGQIITSEAAVSKLHPVMRASTRLLDALTVKGKTEDIRVFEVVWQESEEMTMMVGRTHVPPQQETAVRLVHQGREFMINAERPSAVIGRGEQADIVIQDRLASRIHARIERRRDKFVFVDQSSNGSYITIKGETEIQLRREEFALHGSGSISLGHPYAKDPSEVIEFFCM